MFNFTDYKKNMKKSHDYRLIIINNIRFHLQLYIMLVIPYSHHIFYVKPNQYIVAYKPHMANHVYNKITI